MTLPRRTSLDARLKRIEGRLKKLEDLAEITPSVVSFNWEGLTKRDKTILHFLRMVGREGATTTEIAAALQLPSPQKSGRTIVYRRLKRIEKISRRHEGLSVVVYADRKWSLNFNEFTFKGEEGEKRE